MRRITALLAHVLLLQLSLSGGTAACVESGSSIAHQMSAPSVISESRQMASMALAESTSPDDGSAMCGSGRSRPGEDTSCEMPMAPGVCTGMSACTAAMLTVDGASPLMTVGSSGIAVGDVDSSSSLFFPPEPPPPRE